MGSAQCCSPTEMVRFLLAFCCDANSPDALRGTQPLNKRFGDCLREVLPVANSVEMRERLEK